MRWPEQVQPIIDRAPDGALLAAAAAFFVLAILLVRRHLLLSRRRQAASEYFDAFISYKSEDVEFARRIADRLIGSGRRVWFAEYQILLSGRDQFQEAIDRGIARSRLGIAITSDLYAESDHCRGEMAGLLARLGPQRIIDIGSPQQGATRRIFPALEASPGMNCQGDADAALRFIGLLTGWSIAPATRIDRPAAPRLRRGTCLGLDYEVDVSGWTLVDPSFQGGGPCYGLPDLPLLWNLQCGEELDPIVYDARRGWTKDRNNERFFFEMMADYAAEQFKDVKRAQAFGVHLFPLGGATHFALSYRSGRYWKRRYSLMLVEPQSYKRAEFVFTFQFEGDFHAYCRATGIMDSVAASLRWGPADGADATPDFAPSQAKDRYTRVLDDLPAANKLLDQGMVLMKAGRLAEGIAVLERVLAYRDLSQTRGAAYFNIGLAHERSGDLDAAIANYEAAAAANPLLFNALCNLGSIHHRRGDVRSALDAFLRAAEINPKDYITVNNIVICYQDLGETEQAGEWLARWRELKP